ncbi:MAG: HAD family phosphatase [Anaerolineales bacterium]|nr:HAD family phosphatase [Anaerolineales bacterium]
MSHTIQIPPAVKGLIFDCDGTLADTMALQWAAWHATLAHYGASCPQAFLEARKGVPTEQIVVDVNRAFGCNLPPAAFAAEKERRLLAGLGSVRPFPPVADLVRRCHGRLPMAVASGGERDTIHQIVRIIGLDGYFEAILTAADDVPPKPAPDLFLAAARRLGVRPADCLVLEDADAGVTAARRAGMHIIDVRREAWYPASF